MEALMLIVIIAWPILTLVGAVLIMRRGNRVLRLALWLSIALTIVYFALSFVSYGSWRQGLGTLYFSIPLYYILCLPVAAVLVGVRNLFRRKQQ